MFFFSLAVAVAANEAGILQTETEHCTAATVRLMVLNLDRTERLDGFVQAAVAAGVAQTNLCRIPGVRGDDLPTNSSLPSELITAETWAATVKISHLDLAVAGSGLTMGSVGLAFAHARAWMRLLDSGAPCAIVAEDDVRVYAHSFADDLERACVATRSDDQGLELVQLQADTTSWRKPGASDGGLSFAEVLARREAGKMTVVGGNTDYNMGMYLLTREGARRALAHVFPIAEQIDAEGGVLRATLRAGMCTPPICQAAELGTDAQIRPDSISLDTGGSSRSVPDCANVYADDASDATFLHALAGSVRGARGRDAGGSPA